jgi:hypothetical protein
MESISMQIWERTTLAPADSPESKEKPHAIELHNERMNIKCNKREEAVTNDVKN